MPRSFSNLIIFKNPAVAISCEKLLIFSTWVVKGVNLVTKYSSQYFLQAQEVGAPGQNTESGCITFPPWLS